MPRKRSFGTMESGHPPFVQGSSSRMASLQTTVKRVCIGWKSILKDVVKFLGGTTHVYTQERTSDGMFVVRVRFWIPLDTDGNNHEEVNEVGIACFSLSKAEDHAAYSALIKFESSSFDTKIMDISRLLCEDMKSKKKVMLVQIDEMNHATKILLDEWSRAIEEIEAVYEPLRSDIVMDICHGTDPVYREIRRDVAQQLFKLKVTNGKKLSAAITRFEEVKRNVDEEYDLISNQLEDRLIPRAHEKKGDLPGKIKIDMKLVIDEMIISLGWEQTKLTVSESRNHYYVCEVDFIAGKASDGSIGTRNIIKGDQKLHKIDAIESAALAVIFFLDKEMSIQLVDINSNIRQHAELYMSKAERLLYLASSTGLAVLAEWEETVNGLFPIDQYFRKMVADHPVKEPWNWVHNVKCDSADIVARLHMDCQFRLSLGKRRYKASTTLFESQ